MNQVTPHTDTRFFWWVTAIAVSLAALPYMAGLVLTPPGYVFQGNTILAPGDPNVYYSYIEQARQGAWLMRDVFTSETHAATLWQPVWLVLGWLANLLHVSTPMIYALGRLASVIVFSLTTWWAIRWLWVDRLTRRIGLLTVFGASGIGGLAALASHQSLGGIFHLSPDLWVSEMVPLISSWTTPHFLLVTSGILYVLFRVEQLWRDDSWEKWWLVGLVGLLTLSVHPFHLVTWLTIWTGLTFIRWVKEKKFPLKYLCRWGSVLLISTPAMVYYAAGLLIDPIVIGRAHQNINPTPNIWLLAVGLGLVPILAAVSWVQLQKEKNSRALWVGWWAIAQTIVIYLPLMSQRRLMHGLIVPFALLATIALTAAWKRWGRSRLKKTTFILTAVVVLAGSNMVVGHHLMRDYQLERQGRNSLEYFLRPEYQALFQYLKNSVPNDEIVLASLWDSNLIAGFTARTVFVGHPVETLNYPKKAALMKSFFQTMGPAEQDAMLQEHRICYILLGPREEAYGEVFQPTTWLTLQRVWSGPAMALYRVSGCS